MSPVKVMVVDDEVAFVETLSKRLAKRNLEVVRAYSGLEAIGKLGEESDIDIVVLDVKMPGMTGTDTLREIKKSYPLVEVIILTGHASVSSAIEGMKLGAYDYLLKPCDMDQLMAKIAEAEAKKARHEEKILEAQMIEMTLRSRD
jgi:DNA-binding NtrC family response regulator